MKDLIRRRFIVWMVWAPVWMGACGDDPVAPDWCARAEAAFRVDVGEDVAFRWSESCALEEILVADDLGRVVWAEQGTLQSPVVYGPADSNAGRYAVSYSTPDWRQFTEFAIE